MRDANVALGPGPEFDLVRTMLSRWGALARGVGDDAALLDLPPGSRLAVSTDSSVENVHFRREWLSAEEIAYRAAAAALSDLAAMGAAPLGMVIALTLTDAWRAQVARLADGFAVASRELGAPIGGGNLTKGSELSITVTVLGSVARARSPVVARAPAIRSGSPAGSAVRCARCGHSRAARRRPRSTVTGSRDPCRACVKDSGSRRTARPRASTARMESCPTRRTWQRRAACASRSISTGCRS